ncbi:uncharacterized protein [Primulina eburnea]|uniref:uncharacterized protein n=1 Tax=Primulina eburnea TaxID=1245227 RepID=UPI003C6C635C
MADQTLRTMRYKQWTHYDDWCEIFGNDRATGDQAKTFQHVLHEVLQLDDEVPNDIPIDGHPTFSMQQTFEDSVSETNATSSKPKAGATSKSKKRKLSVDADESIVAAINNLAHITKDTMGELIKELSGVDKIAAIQDKVLEALAGIKELTEDEQVMVAKLLLNNHNDLALFERLGDKGRLTLVRRLLNGQ